jgi:hypothetical protein
MMYRAAVLALGTIEELHKKIDILVPMVRIYILFICQNATTIRADVFVLGQNK